MFKKISALLIAAALIGGVTSCYMPDSIFPDSGFDTDEENFDNDALSIYDFEFGLSGVEYELPMHYSVLSSRGWEMTGDKSDETDDAASDLPADNTNKNTTQADENIYTSDTVIGSQEYSDYVSVERGGECIFLKFYNDSKRSQKLEDCLVVGVMVEVDSDMSADFTLNGDITLGNTYEEVVTTYGKPSYTKDFAKSDGELAAINDIAFTDDYDQESDDFTRTLYYSVADTSVVSFELGDYEGKSDSVVRITMDNIDPVEEEYDYSKDLKKRSSIIKLYKTPNLLGKTFNDFAFKYENNLYTLPIPVQTLINDGWVFVRGAGQNIPKGATQDGVIMRKGNLAMSIIVHNYDLKRSQTPVNCYAVSLSASVVGPNVKILMPKGVTLGSEYSELVTAFGSEYAELSGYVDDSEQADDGEEDEETDNKAVTAVEQLPIGTTETYELTDEEGCVIVKTVEEDYTVYSYIMPDDVPTITLPVSITDIKDPNSALLGENRKHIDVYMSNVNGRVIKIELQNCPEYFVNEAEILEQQMEAAQKAAEEAAQKAAEEAASGDGKTDKSEKADTTDSQTDKTVASSSSATAKKDESEKVKDANATDAADKAEQSGGTVKASAGIRVNNAIIAHGLEAIKLLDNNGLLGAD